MFEQARLANENPPRCRLRRQGAGDMVEFHPAYHRFMADSIAAGLHCLDLATRTRARGRRAGRGRARGALLHGGAGRDRALCPITMTRAAVAALAAEPALLAKLLPKIVSRSYDPSFRPWWEKIGVTLGMGMTEKQGGTDVRANTTPRRVARRRRLPHHRPQMVHVGADVATPSWCWRRRRAG